MTIRFSLEVFPPKTREGLDDLAALSTELAPIAPEYVSVTYGAGGSNQERSFAAIDALHDASDADVAAHLTCVGQTRAEVESVIDRFSTLGVKRIVALRGDPPTGIDQPYVPHRGGFTSTADLVRAIKERGAFWVAVSAYPEVHPQSPSASHDIDVLAAKVAAGANAAMTQMFFDNERFFAYRDRVRSAGIDVPLIPGIFPIHDFSAVQSFASRCGATMPESISDRFAQATAAADPDRAAFQTAVDVACEQINDLAAHGVDHFHLYTLNRSELSLAVVDRLRA